MTQVTNPTQPAVSLPGASGSSVVGVGTANRISLSNLNDIILTFGGDDVIAGNNGDDIVFSGGGNDSIGGGSGNDALVSGSGNDAVSGGDGDDRIFGGKGNDQLDGGAGNDLVSGDQGNDFVIGGTGNDTLFGGAGSDTVGGGDGNDTIWGGKGNDTVDGGAGNDFISGDRGSDFLTGGAGSDTFYFATSVVTGTLDGIDTITDFTPGEDKIRLKQGGVFAGLGSSFEASEFVVVSNFSANSPGSTTNKLIYDPTSGALFFNGGNGVLQVAQLTPGLTITSNNFELF